MIGMSFDELHLAEVVDNNDPKKEGRVKINIPPIMQGWTSDHLPWARPFMNITGGDSSVTNDPACFIPDSDNSSTDAPKKYGQSFIPEMESSVLIWFADSKFKKNPYYITGIQVEGNNPHNSFYLKAIPNLTGENLNFDLNYPNVKFIHLLNQSSYFMSSKKKFPEGGYYFSKKSYFYAKEDRTTDQASTSKVRLKSGTDNYLDLSFDEASTTSKIQIGQANTAQPNTIEISTVSTTPSMKLTAGTDSLQKMCLAETLKQNYPIPHRALTHQCKQLV
jgi:hypothetical protein